MSSSNSFTPATDNFALDLLPDLPSPIGFAGMYAGRVNDQLICMGGANFPDKFPWEGGRKLFYDDIYLLKGNTWTRLNQKMEMPAAYGVSVTYRNTIIAIGGIGRDGYLRAVTGYSIRDNELAQTRYPDLPIPLGNMTGGLLGDKIIIAGGSPGETEAPVNRVFLIDPGDEKPEWLEIEPFPGPGRILAACGFLNDQFYLFSGIRTDISAGKQKYSHALTDAYRLTVSGDGATVEAHWELLAQMPRAVAGIGYPVPTLKNGKMLFWGGVDAMASLHPEPSSFPGITGKTLLYDGNADLWSLGAEISTAPARVTLPVVCWKQQWVYISGEVKPGKRTNSIVSIKG